MRSSTYVVPALSAVAIVTTAGCTVSLGGRPDGDLADPVDAPPSLESIIGDWTGARYRETYGGAYSMMALPRVYDYGYGSTYTMGMRLRVGEDESGELATYVSYADGTNPPYEYVYAYTFSEMRSDLARWEIDTRGQSLAIHLSCATASESATLSCDMSWEDGTYGSRLATLDLRRAP